MNILFDNSVGRNWHLTVWHLDNCHCDRIGYSTCCICLQTMYNVYKQNHVTTHQPGMRSIIIIQSHGMKSKWVISIYFNEGENSKWCDVSVWMRYSIQNSLLTNTFLISLSFTIHLRSVNIVYISSSMRFMLTGVWALDTQMKILMWLDLVSILFKSFQFLDSRPVPRSSFFAHQPHVLQNTWWYSMSQTLKWEIKREFFLSILHLYLFNKHTYSFVI